MTEPKLPTIKIGVGPDDEAQKTADNAGQAIAHILNGLPADLIYTVVCSAVLTFVANQPNPGAAFRYVGEMVGSHLEAIMMPAQGSVN